MTKEELANELYELIVVKGRWGGVRRPNDLLGDSYATLPRWMQETWDDEAVRFAHRSNFTLEDS